MLPCQHTFCLHCVQKLAKESPKIRCAQCRAETIIPKGGATSLPSNIYAQSVLEFVLSELNSDEMSRASPGCHVCGTVCDVKPCEHCSRSYCAICEQRHLLELEQQLKGIREQVLATKGRTAKRIKLFSELCDQVKESVHLEIQNRVKLILEAESKLARQIDDICERGRSLGLEILQKLEANSEKILELLKEEFENASTKTAQEKVTLFLELHKESSANLETADATSLGTLSFSPDTMTVTGTSSNVTEAIVDHKEECNEYESLTSTSEDIRRRNESQVVNVSDNSHSLYYRTRPFLPKARLGSAFLQRPAGVAVSPWSKEIYVVSMDSHRVYVFDIDRKKFLRSFGSRGQRSGEFMCPYGIALSPITQEIFVTDKWKHCIHVFSRGETFLRQIGSKGSGQAQFRSPESICVDKTGNMYICDTINNRIQVLNKDGSFVREIDGQTSNQDPNSKQKRTLFQEPAGIAVTPEGQRLIVCDFSNHRIHVFSAEGVHLLTCGQKGSLRGQFNNPECVAVDYHGFIFVGDSGNCRVQILRPDGRFVRSFGSKGSLSGHFNWISGIAVTPSHEVAVCDFKNHCVQIF